MKERVGLTKYIKELGDSKRVGNITSWESYISWAKFKIDKSRRMNSLVQNKELYILEEQLRLGYGHIGI
jgi:hypothetical protein